MGKQFAGVACRIGPPLLRESFCGDPKARVRLFRVKMIDGGAYDTGGGYWGPGRPLYCARDGEGLVSLFRRGDSRAEVKGGLLKEFPGLKFYR